MSEIVEHPEYNNSDNPYPSFGKRYCGERAIISLTSWKMRIHTVAKTLYSLYTMCPGFHIVLVLSEEEFPKMCEELPENLMLFVENEMIELLWVYKNYKSFKKWIFTADKYRDVPIISADDDCIYKYNYAEELYNNYLKNKNSVITETTDYNGKNAYGYATLYFPHFFELTNDYINAIKLTLNKSSHDDCFIKHYRLKKKINLLSLHHPLHNVVHIYNSNSPLGRTRWSNEDVWIGNIVRKIK